MKAKASIAPPWGRVGVGLLAVVIVLASLVTAGVVLGKPKLTVVTDRRGDGGRANQGLGHCDLIRATSKLAKHGRVRHTVTMGGPVGANFNAPAVYITKHRVVGQRIPNPLVLFPGQRGVRTHFSSDRRTVIYYLKRRTVKHAVHRSDKYFWLADQVNCEPPTDSAPNHGSVSQPLKPRHHR